MNVSSRLGSVAAVKRGVLLAFVLALASTPVRADDIVTYEVEGDAPAAGADPRGAAVDDAFARAVQSALADLVTADLRTSHKGVIDREIIGHARLWIARFSVTKDDANEDRRQLTVSVRIDRDKLRARLEELKIATKVEGGDPGAIDGAPQRSVTILLRTRSSKGSFASYGKAADRDTLGLGGLTTLLRSNGMAVRRAPETGTVGDGDFPISDAEADQVAEAAKADLIAIAGVSVGDAVPVRGRPMEAVLVTAHLRLVERKSHQVIGQGTARAAAPADDHKYAIERALTAAAADVLPPQPTKLAQAAAFVGDDTPLAEPGVILVRLGAKTPYALVGAEQRYLAGAKGVRAASLRRLSPSGWVIGVTTNESIDRIAQIAKKPPATDASATVKIVGSVVEVALTGAP
ncbi:hypothetical protein BH11MYX1_BH11MYX1_52500 [soil metagenome]